MENKIKKMIKNIINNNIKLFLGMILGVVLSGSCVFAATTIIKSADVTYSTATSGGTSSNVQGAIDELYKKAKSLSGGGDTGELYQESTLNGAYPELYDKLIPVTIDETTGKVTYANLNTKWYSYEEKKWANAVILVGTPSKDYKTGDEIAEKDIQSYFVWIPRFSYRIWDTGNYTGASLLSTLGSTSLHNFLGNPRIIDVNFESKSRTENGTTVGNFLTHPAFTQFKVNGFWVGKFELGYNQTSGNGSITSTGTFSGACQNSIGASYWGGACAGAYYTTCTPSGGTTGPASNCGVPTASTVKVMIKPGVYVWHGNTVKNLFLSSYGYYRQMNSHMIMNMEWGAVAYLSHSVYGAANRININPSVGTSGSLKTGIGMIEGTDRSTYPTTTASYANYNMPDAKFSSTTGNITGVYDMSGGGEEVVAGYSTNLKNVSTTYFAFTSYEQTAFSSYLSTFGAGGYTNFELGDATKEIGPFFTYPDSNGDTVPRSAWYYEKAILPSGSNAYVTRGGSYNDGVRAGLFAFDSTNDYDAKQASGAITTRVVLDANYWY